MKSVIVFLMLLLAPGVALAEGRCPPGQYPIGDDRAPGCAPIPGASVGGGATGSPTPTGKWETRWGAIAEDTAPSSAGLPLATGVSKSRKSKRDANSAAMAECVRMGGVKCKVRTSYYNQCVALADPSVKPGSAGSGLSTSFTAVNEDEAKSLALESCEKSVGGQRCEIIYSACSMSEFKAF